MIDYNLEDKVVLVTGANNPYGIGGATARVFAKEGCKVFITFQSLCAGIGGIRRSGDVS